MFKTLLAFLNIIPIWFQGVANNRALAGDSGVTTPPAASTPGRPWFIQSIGYTKNLLLSNLQTITNRTELNTGANGVVNRLAVSDVNSKQGVSALRIEIAQLYSFQKCFVARHKCRLQYYRDDLTQKTYRNMYAMQLSYDNFTLLQSNCDAPQ
jgi:hypothetical protein